MENLDYLNTTLFSSGLSKISEALTRHPGELSGYDQKLKLRTCTARSGRYRDLKGSVKENLLRLSGRMDFFLTCICNFDNFLRAFLNITFPPV